MRPSSVSSKQILTLILGRLEVQEPLPYNIMAKLELTQDPTKEAKEKIDQRFLEPQFPAIRMQMGRNVDGNRVYVRKDTSLTVYNKKSS